MLGNALEFYDFTTYAFFAVMIGHAFFPHMIRSSACCSPLPRSESVSSRAHWEAS